MPAGVSVCFIWLVSRRHKHCTAISLMLLLLFSMSLFNRPEVNLKKYSGCLKDIEISRTPYNILSSPDYVGVTKGCSLEVSSFLTAS